MKSKTFKKKKKKYFDCYQTSKQLFKKIQKCFFGLSEIFISIFTGLSISCMKYLLLSSWRLHLRNVWEFIKKDGSKILLKVGFLHLCRLIEMLSELTLSNFKYKFSMSSKLPDIPGIKKRKNEQMCSILWLATIWLQTVCYLNEQWRP